MDIASVQESLRRRLAAGFDVYRRRPGDYQIILPILHEDGDMVDIYLRDSPKDETYVRICDYGMTLMRLSYTFDPTTDARRRILDSILIDNGVQNDNGNLYIDTPADMIYESVLQFAGCVQKVCNMRYWNRETVRRAFYDDLEEYITTALNQFSPVPDQAPIHDYPITVDWSLTQNDRSFYVFGVRGNDKAKNVAIALLEFQKARLPFISLVVHENMEDLGGKERTYLTRNADTQYPILDDFQANAVSDIERIAGTAA